MGFHEIEHLSDRAILVNSSSLETLFEDAAAGMYAIMDVQCEGETIEREISVSGVDTESLLVGFLSEALSTAEIERLAIKKAQVILSEDCCRARVTLAPISHMNENIKAVTYSQMQITRKDGRYETIVVFDL